MEAALHPDVLENGIFFPSSVTESLTRRLLGVPDLPSEAARVSPLVVALYSSVARDHTGIGRWSLIFGVATVACRATFRLLNRDDLTAATGALLAFISFSSAVAFGRHEALQLACELVFLVLLNNFARARRNAQRWHPAVALAMAAALCTALSPGDSDWGLGIAAAAAPWAGVRSTGTLDRNAGAEEKGVRQTSTEGTREWKRRGVEPTHLRNSLKFAESGLCVATFFIFYALLERASSSPKLLPLDGIRTLTSRAGLALRWGKENDVFSSALARDELQPNAGPFWYLLTLVFPRFYGYFRFVIAASSSCSECISHFVTYQRHIVFTCITSILLAKS